MLSEQNSNTTPKINNRKYPTIMQPMNVEISHEEENKGKKHVKYKNILKSKIGIGVLMVTIFVIAGMISLQFRSSPQKSDLVVETTDEDEQDGGESSNTVYGNIFSDDLLLNSNVDGKPAILHYLHCRAPPSESNLDSKNAVEIVLLHGAAFTAQDWDMSGILNDLCNNSNANSTSFIRSVTALDLEVSANGDKLWDVYNRLVSKKILSGKPVYIISPSASGKAVLSLAENTYKSGSKKMKKMMKGWIPVACFATKSTDKKVLNIFPKLNIPVMAVYGSLDKAGALVSEKLVSYAGATKEMIEGTHPCYLDSPLAFIILVQNFVAMHVKT